MPTTCESLGAFLNSADLGLSILLPDIFQKTLLLVLCHNIISFKYSTHLADLHSRPLNVLQMTHNYLFVRSSCRTEGTVNNFTSTVRVALAPTANNIGNTVDSLGDSLYNVTTGQLVQISNDGHVYEDYCSLMHLG